MTDTLPRICFVHVPKTAGTSITDFLSGMYGDQMLPAITTLDYERYSESHLETFRCYAGHSYWRDYIRLPGDTRIFTVLRDPTQRVISLYKYWRSVDASHLSEPIILDALKVAQTASIYEFIASPNPFIRQAVVCGQVRQFVRTSISTDVELLSSSQTGRDQILSHVFNTFSHFEAVLTAENIAMSFPVVMRALKVGEHHQLPHLNSSQSRVDVNIQRVHELLYGLSSLDYVIYDLAQSLEASYLRQDARLAGKQV